MKIIPLIILISTFFISVCGLNAEIVKILIQGDSQKIMDPRNGKQDNFVPFMSKVLTDPVTRDADFILQMGDIIEDNVGNVSEQYAVARQGWQALGDHIPYALNIGNTDDVPEFLAAFDYLPEPLSTNYGGQNFAYEFTAGGVEWLIISMRYSGGSSTKSETDWAYDLIQSNTNKKIIFIKHEVNVDSTLVNNLKKYPNVVFVLSGHTLSEHRFLTGDNGNPMPWIRTCHHDAKRDSYFRMLLIDTIKGTVRSSFYSPQYEKFLHDPSAPYHRSGASDPWVLTGFDFGASEGVRTVGNDAQFMSLDVPSHVFPSSAFTATAVFENVGTTEWDADLLSNKYKLGSENSRDNVDWGVGTSRTLVSESVLPGEAHTFEINCVGPTDEGYYNFQRRMVREGVEWFGELSENRIMYVSSDKVVDGSFEEESGSLWILGDSASRSSNDSVSGDFSLMLSGSTTVTKRTVAIDNYTDYEVRFWARADMVEGSGNVVFDTNDVFDSAGEGQFVIGSSLTEWRQFKGRFNSGDKDSVTFRILGKNLKGAAFFDDIVLVPMRPSPNFKSVYDVTAYVDENYSLTIDTSAFDVNTLGYESLSLPGWLTLNIDNGVFTLSGTPAKEDIGVHAVTFNVMDTENREFYTFVIKVYENTQYSLWNQFHKVGPKRQDADDDGIQNLLEFALGGEPNENESNAILPRLSLDGDDFEFTFRRHQSAPKYKLLESEDLIHWTDHTIINDVHGHAGDQVKVKIPAQDGKKFFRLEVSE